MFLLGKKDLISLFSLTCSRTAAPHDQQLLPQYLKERHLKALILLFSPTIFFSLQSLTSFRILPKSLNSVPSKPYSFLVSSEDFVSSFPSFSGSFGCSASLDAAGTVSVSCSSPTEADSSEVTSASRKCEKASSHYPKPAFILQEGRRKKS